MSKKKQPSAGEPPEELFGRVVSILEQARGNVVRAVNTNMVLAYWLIGREIVEELQGGGERAEYGRQVMANLARQLTQKYGQGFSVTNLQNFRKFHQAYAHRPPQIQHPLGIKFGLSDASPPIQHPPGAELAALFTEQGIELALSAKSSPLGSQSVPTFSPQLTWSHYRALMRVENLEARDFYEREAIEGGWDKRTLERQIQSFYYERMLKSAKPAKMLAEGRRLPVPASSPVEALKNPYVLEFLGLPDVADFHESDLERAIITHLQRFLMELGSGFAFVARQKQIRIGEQERYIDLVFYHCRLKFYLLVDLKVGELTHADVGQMDGYVRMFDDLVVAPDDNPTIGLILCTEKNETVARYSVLNDRKQIFASRYMLFLPTEEQLRLEIEKERRLIESNLEDQADA